MKKIVVILCIVIALCILLLVMPSAAANLTATISPSTVAHGDKVFINGTAEGQPSSVAIWILGKNFASRDTETVNVDGSFSYEITQDTTNALYSDQYFVVVQHPGMNNVYDIDICPTNPVGSTYVCDYAVGQGPVSLFKIYGPGSLQGSDAADALVTAINQPYIDDTYTELQFRIMPNLTATVSPSTVAHGDKIFINGTAGDQPSSVAIWILGWNFASRDTETVNVDGSFSYEITQDTTNALYSDTYFVVVQHPGMNGLYDIDICPTNPVGSTYVCDYAVGPGPVSIFKLSGPGSLLGYYAADALVTAINQPYIDDPYIDDTCTIHGFKIISSSKIGVFRPSAHMFYLKNGSALSWTTTAINWGISTDLPVTGDWNGDGRTDVGVYRPSAHMFYLKNGSALSWTTTAINWGISTDLPVTGDWNGDGRTDVGVYRPSAHMFYLRSTSYPATPAMVMNFGASTDLPVTGDWNEDGITEVGVYRPSAHTFYLNHGIVSHYLQIITFTEIINWGVSTDLPVTGKW